MLKKVYLFFAAVVLGLALTHGSGFADTVNVYVSNGDPNLLTTKGRPGKVVKMTPTVVSLERETQTFEIPVNEIESIHFDNAPAPLMAARLALQIGDLTSAAESLALINPSEITHPFLRQEVEFCRALVAAREVLIPDATREEISQGARLMLAFIRDHKESWHFIEANETIGDLLVAAGSMEPALQYYKQLIEAPWSDYQMKGQIATANIDLLAGRINEAKDRFNVVIGSPEGSPYARLQKSVAKIGLSRCFAQEGDLNQAIAAIENVIAEISPEDFQRSAVAYNLLGDFSLVAEKKNDALLAYMHVDLLYSKVRIEHIKALRKLADLWKERGRIDRESEVRQTLRERYGIATPL